jgi:archaellum component FlaF (FlaF/FlaG flagellin family)
MGFSVSATMAIFFASFLILFSILYSSVNSAFDDMQTAFDEKYDGLQARSDTSLSIIDTAYYKEDNSLVIDVLNTGSTSLDVNCTQLLVDGVLTSSATFQIQGVTTEIWQPNELLTITLTNPDIGFSSDVYVRMDGSNNAQLTSPTNITAGEKVYIVDGTGIDVFSLDGTYEFAITDTVNTPTPGDVKIYGDYLYVMDNASHVDRFTLDGVWVDSIVYDAVNTPTPRSIAVDSDYIYVVDDYDHIDRYNRAAGTFVNQLIPNGGTMTSPMDLSVGAYIFVIDRASGLYHVDRYALDGTGGAMIVDSARLASPTDISASSAGLQDTYVYIANNSREILVFDESGTYQGSVDDGLSSSVRGVDATGKIFVLDGVNGLVTENLGTSIKVVAENGVSKIDML